MYEWHRAMQAIVDEIDRRIQAREDETPTLHQLAQLLGYSDFYMTRKFREITGLSLREYMTTRRRGPPRPQEHAELIPSCGGSWLRVIADARRAISRCARTTPRDRPTALVIKPVPRDGNPKAHALSCKTPEKTRCPHRVSRVFRLIHQTRH